MGICKESIASSGEEANDRRLLGRKLGTGGLESFQGWYPAGPDQWPLPWECIGSF